MRVLGDPVWAGQWATVVPFTTPGATGPLYSTPPTTVVTVLHSARKYGTLAVDHVDEIAPGGKAHYVLSGVPEILGGRVVVYLVQLDTVDIGQGVTVAIVDTRTPLDPLVQLALEDLVTQYLLPRMPRGATWDRGPRPLE